MSLLDDLLALNRPLLADGATGTSYFARGLASGDPPELWLTEHPERVKEVHAEFVAAGSDIILTNSFGANAFRLKLHDMQDRVFELNRRAAELAREVADAAGRPVAVAGSVGPTGELFAPLGAMTYDDAVAAFTEQAKGLKAGGADILWIETMSAPEEVKAAAEAAAAVDMPYCFTFSFDTAGRTMMGMKPTDVPALGAELPGRPVAMGGNCGVGAPDLLASMLAMREAAPGAVLIAKGNCGIPQVHGDHLEYSGTPELMADYARLAVDCGVRIVGGCCGTTARHVAAMAEALAGHEPGPPPTIDEIVARLGPTLMKHAHDGEAPAGRTRRSRRRD
ncbi:betaine--homocysteine S-methyltransferase [Lutibaculum baratangense]|uniref:Betaine--homocysteine S-methyltransferase n=1 Tax=Lutibaculum baratangense AMV1 TaxID=631454 RepID=V4R413_9HYPH|nr:betaine--homocysteine S-methyltransferase [Lutibaculum baratangense]ESR26702.1 Betaine--homocysteine S-methyltransferase [Lutibaculum baratangense AMV1]